MGDENGSSSRPDALNPSEELPLKRALETDQGETDPADTDVAKAESETTGAKGANHQDVTMGDGASAAGGEASAAGDTEKAKTTFQIVVGFKKDKFELDVSESDLVRDVKLMLEPLTGVPADNQKLMFKGMLADISTLGDSGLKAGVKNMKLMLIGTSTAEIAKQHLDKIVATVQAPVVSAQAAAAARLTEITEHKKVIEKGVPEGATPGVVGRKAPLIEVQNVIRNVYDKRGELVRLTFKLEENQLWIGGKSRTDKLSLGQIRTVSWEPIKDHAGYNILILQAGATDKSNLYFYFVPAQYCDDVRRIILS